MHDQIQTPTIPQNLDHRDDMMVVGGESFCIDTPESANWLIRKVLERRRYRERVKAWAEAEMQRAEAEEQNLLCRFGSQLEEWLRKELTERGGRRRSVDLPAGSVGFRAQPTRLAIGDESSLITWCRSHLTEALQVKVEAIGTDALELERWAINRGEEVQMTISVGKAAVNQYFSSTGELPSGVQIDPPCDVFTIK